MRSERELLKEWAKYQNSLNSKVTGNLETIYFPEVAFEAVWALAIENFLEKSVREMIDLCEKEKIRVEYVDRSPGWIHKAWENAIAREIERENEKNRGEGFE